MKTFHSILIMKKRLDLSTQKLIKASSDIKKFKIIKTQNQKEIKLVLRKIIEFTYALIQIIRKINLI